MRASGRPSYGSHLQFSIRPALHYWNGELLSISGAISADGRSLVGQYNIEFGSYIRSDRGSFKIHVTT